jgi:hypothetical protein
MDDIFKIITLFKNISSASLSSLSECFFVISESHGHGLQFALSSVTRDLHVNFGITVDSTLRRCHWLPDFIDDPY